jgi:hypothetical protein
MGRHTMTPPYKLDALSGATARAVTERDDKAPEARHQSWVLSGSSL